MIAAAEATRDRLLATGGPVDVDHAMRATTFAIIADPMLSGAGAEDAARYERELGTYLGAVNWLAALAMAGLPAGTPFPGRRRAMAAAGWLRRSVDAMVAARRGSAAGAARRDLVALLLAARDPETGRGLADRDIADNLLTFIAAGHETTAQGLSWTLRLLADAPEIEAALVAEVEAVTAGGPLRPDHVGRLDLTGCVFSEAMRLYPPAPLIERRVERQIVLDGRPVAPGTMLIVPIHALHRRAGLWDAPDRFDPSRFGAERAGLRHRFAYMPFGAGPRTCIGSGFAITEAVAILAVLLRALRLTSAGDPIPPTRMRLTLQPARPILLTVEPRRRPRQSLPPASDGVDDLWVDIDLSEGDVDPDGVRLLEAEERPVKIDSERLMLRKKASALALSKLQARTGSVSERVEKAFAVASRRTGTFESKYAKQRS